eukprot:25796_1
MSKETCKTDSWIPTWVTIGFIGGTFLMVLVTSWYSFKSVSSHSNKASKSVKSSTYHKPTAQATDERKVMTSQWEQAGCCGKVKLWFKDVWKRKSVYVPLMSHLSDTATDFAAIVEFYQIASMYSATQCGGINMWYLFGLSVTAMLVYRVISSMVIWRITRSCTRVITQFLDIQLFQILWLSHRLGLKNKSNPQRLISVMEAVFEAAPQSMIQVIYLLKTEEFIGIIALSSALSFINLTLAIIGDDKQLLQITKFSAKAIRLYLFRVLDVPSSILLYAFTWHFINGYVTAALLMIDVIVAIYCFVKTKNTDALLSMIAMPLHFGGVASTYGNEPVPGQMDEDQRKALLKTFYAYSLIRCVLINAFIWVQITVIEPIDDKFDTNSVSSMFWLYTSGASIIKYGIGLCVLRGYHVWRDYSFMTKERTDMKLMIGCYNYDDAIELIFYLNLDMQQNAKELYTSDAHELNRKSNSDIHSLLSIAALCTANTHLFPILLNETGLDNLDQDNYTTALVCAVREQNTQQMELLLAIADYSYLMKNDGSTALCSAIERCSDNVSGTKPWINGDYVWTREVDEESIAVFILLLKHMKRILQSEEDRDHKTIELLNNLEDGTETALLLACYRQCGLLVFRSLYEMYPVAYRHEVLMTADHEDNTLLSILKDEEQQNVELIKFIQREINSSSNY